MPRKPVYTTPDDAERAFYDAFERCDLEAMMSVWAEGDHIVCVHPSGGSALRGTPQILESWLHIFARDVNLKFTLHEVLRTETDDLAIHTGEEHIRRKDDPEVLGVVLFTNVFQRSERGWKLIVHQATTGGYREAELAEESAPGGVLH